MKRPTTLGQEKLGVVVRNTENDAPRQAVARQVRQGCGLDLQHTAGMVDQALALGRQPRAAAVLDEERAIEPLLEAPDMHRDGALRLVHPIGRAGEATRVDDGQEGAKLVGIEHD